MVKTDYSDKSVSNAVELYLEDREQELAVQTLQSHRYRLSHLIRFCNQNEIESINEISPMVLTRYKRWRKRDGDLNITSMHTQLTTIRVFIKWCEDMSLLPGGTHKSIRVPQLNGEDRRTRRLDSEVAKHILEYLDRYKYAHRDHVIMRLLWRAALRVGSLYSLDVDDYYADVKQLEIAHRPDQGTPIKKAHNGERRISLNDKTCAIIEDYVENRRYDVTDEYQRKPLLTSKHGRLTISSIRRAVYKWTQPCQYTGDCPHGRVLSECDAKGYTSTTGCPSSLSPHDIRRGAITNFLADDIPKEIVQDRCDVTSDVIDDHYDTRSESEKAEQRRKYIK